MSDLKLLSVCAVIVRRVVNELKASCSSLPEGSKFVLFYFIKTRIA